MRCFKLWSAAAMPPLFARIQSGGMAAALQILVATSAFAQAAEPPGHYAGVASCVNSGCHGATEPLKAQRIRQNEYYTWLHSDRHAQSYNVLFNPLSARIARN